MKYKILFVDTSYGNSVVGAGRFVELLKRKSSLNISVISENLNGEQYPEDYSIDINLSGLKKKLSVLNRTPFYQKKVRELEQDFNCVVINNPLLAHNMKSPKNKTIVFIHDYNYMEIRKIQSKHDIVRIIYRYFEKRTLRKSSYIVANSIFVKDMLIDVYGINPDSIHLLYQGIDLNQYRFKIKEDISPKNVKVLYIKTDWRRGRLDLLVNALGSLTDFNFTITVCGPIPPKPLQSYSNVKLNLLGSTPHDKIIDLYQQNDIFCTPVIREALGVANMEAMASGIPIITTNVGGIPEVVSSEEGWICQPNDLTSLTTQILACLENPRERIRKVRNAYSKVQNFSIQNTVKDFEKIVQKVCDSN